MFQSAGVPVVPWSGSGIFLPKEMCEQGNSDIEVTQELRASACVNDHEEAIRVMNVRFFRSLNLFFVKNLSFLTINIFKYEKSKILISIFVIRKIDKSVSFVN